MKKVYYLIVLIAIFGLIVSGCIPVVPPSEQSEIDTLPNRSPGIIDVPNAAPKVTGDVWFTTLDGYPRHIWFDAHEAYAGRPVKGEFHQEDGCGGGYNYYDGYVIDVKVYIGYADFATHIYAGTGYIGQTFYLRVYDGGEPGIGNDTVGGGIDNPSYSGFKQWTIYEGNLVVHNHIFE